MGGFEDRTPIINFLSEPNLTRLRQVRHPKWFLTNPSEVVGIVATIDFGLLSPVFNLSPILENFDAKMLRGIDASISERQLYCHRKFRPLSKPRLCYNNNLLGRSIRWRTKRRRFTPEFKAEVVIEALSGESSQAELCRRHNLSADQLSKWKQQLLENAATLFESTDKQSDASIERIAQLEQLVGRLTLALEIQKKASTLLS